MKADSFTHMFPEWVLSDSLWEACKQDATRLWKQDVVQLCGEKSARSLASIFDISEAPKFFREDPFPKPSECAARFQISDQKRCESFWGLRPDFSFFLINSVCVFLEAKSGETSPFKRSGRPKETRYYELLHESGL